MNSRQRILCSLDHHQPDRVPIDLGGHHSSSFSVQAYRDFRNYLGLKPSKLYIHDFIQQLALTEEDVLDILHVDTVNDAQVFLYRPEIWKDWELPDGTPCKIPNYIDVRKNSVGDSEVYNNDGVAVAIQKKGCLYFDQLVFPYAEKVDDDFSDFEEQSKKMMWQAIQSPPFPISYDAAGIAYRIKAADELRQTSDRAIYNIFGGSLLEYLNQAFRMDNSLCNLLIEPEIVNAFLDRAMEKYMRDLESFMAANGGNVDIIGWSDDLGGQSAPLMSVQTFRKFFKPRYQELWGYAKKLNPNVKLCLHSCGAIAPFIGDLIECGMDAVNPVQITCNGMELVYLKKEFGKDITFWGGGCDTREILPSAEPQQIKDHVKKNLDIMMPGGGFVFQQIHNILANVPPQNVMAMFEAVHEYNA